MIRNGGPMLGKLLESKRTKKRSLSGTLFSVALHSVILFLAVYATARASGRIIDRPKAEKVAYVEVKKKDPPPPEEKKPDPPKPKLKKVEAPKVVNIPRLPKEVPVAPPKGFQVLQPPVNISVNLPKIDLSAKVTDASDFTGKGVKGGTGGGVEGGTGDATSKGTDAGTDMNKVFKEFEVESPAEKIGGPSPVYPEGLRSSGIEGEVMVQFVVNENGRYEPGTLKILDSSNPQFSAAVKAALPLMRFSAARVGGQKVQQLVQIPFEFHLNR
jgi:protein TonB